MGRASFTLRSSSVQTLQRERGGEREREREREDNEVIRFTTLAQPVARESSHLLNC